MTRPKKIPLNLKLALAIVIGLAVSVMVYLVADNLALSFIDNVYLSDEAIENRTLDKVEEFSRYVSKNKIKSDDMNAILKWQNMEEDVYILVYKNNRLIFNSTWWDDDMIMDSVYQIDEVIEEETDTTQSDVSESDSADMTSQDYVQNSETDNYLWNIKNSVSVAEEIAEEAHEDQIEEDEKAGAEEDQTEEDEKTGAGEDKTEENNTGEAYSHEMVLIDDASDEYKFYPVKFDDGVYDVCVIDYSDYNIYNIALIIELALSGIVFMCIILWYNRRLINRVSRLSTEIVHIENDDINAPITKTGRDELQVLSENIDSMRDTIIEQLSNEREAWQANRDLVTSMAHDIRTPLTVLNGYLDLLNEKEYDSEEAMEEYLNICSEKAEQLKDLSDKLFRYFFVYSGKKDDLNFEIYDAGVLFQQMLGEYIILLREKGFEFNVVKLKDNVNISVDSIYLKRLFDNVFTNIRKYAEKSEPVNVNTFVEDSHVILSFENVVSHTRNESESTKIGIKTCEKIAQEMNMSFTTEENADKYKVSVMFNIEI